jgi:hypothetical protein
VEALREFRRELNSTMTQISSSIANLDRKIEAVKQKTEGKLQNKISSPSTNPETGLRHFESVLNANLLIESFVPDAPINSDEIIMAQKRHSNLSQRDHWENNGVLEPLSVWSTLSTTSETSVFWIGGQGRKEDPWVTELSVDIVLALSAQDINMTLAYVFFDSLPGKILTATEFMRLVIARIIEQRPQLILELPAVLNTRSLRQSSSFLTCWRIFEQIVMRLDATFLILDRIDVSGEGAADGSTVELILPRILELVSRMAGKLRVIITSTQKPPTAYEKHPKLSSFWRDTGIRPVRREDRS